MDPRDNPYTPNAGAQPPAVTGRDPELHSFEVLLERLQRGRTEQSMIVTGLRGVGKTVLLGRFREQATSRDWIVVEREISKHSNDQFRRDMAADLRRALFTISPKSRWGSRTRQAAAVLKSFTLSIDPAGIMTAGLDVDAAEGFADQGHLQSDFTDLLIAIGEAAKESDRGVVLLLDEVQFFSTEQLEALIAGIHKTVQRSLPVTMVAAGLPQIAELAGDAKSYSERLFTFPRIGNLSPDDAKAALREPCNEAGADFDEDALELAVDLTGGYPYFLQELGYAAWNLADEGAITLTDIQTTKPLYEAKLDESFFRVRLDRTTELQRNYLRAMAELGPDPQQAQEVAAVMGRQSTEAAPTRAQLIEMGLLYTPDYGYAAFTVPHFDKFLLRAIPDFEPIPVKRRGSTKVPARKKARR